MGLLLYRRIICILLQTNFILMNRYLFWLLMLLPWTMLTIFIEKSARLGLERKATAILYKALS